MYACFATNFNVFLSLRLPYLPVLGSKDRPGESKDGAEATVAAAHHGRIQLNHPLAIWPSTTAHKVSACLWIVFHSFERGGGRERGEG